MPTFFTFISAAIVLCHAREGEHLLCIVILKGAALKTTFAPPSHFSPLLSSRPCAGITLHGTNNIVIPASERESHLLPKIFRDFYGKFFELCRRRFVEGGLERDRILAERDVLERVENLVHLLCCHRSPCSVFDNADFAVAVILRLDVRQESFGGGEKPCVKRCGANGEVAVAERLRDRFRNVRAAQILDGHIDTFCTERFGELLRGFCRVSVNARVSDEHALRFGGVAAPSVILVDVEI